MKTAVHQKIRDRLAAALTVASLAIAPGPALALRPAGLEESGAKTEFAARVGHAAGAEEPQSSEVRESPLTAAQLGAAQGRYRLLTGTPSVEYDPKRSIPCALGHPPLLWRVRVLDTQTNRTAYIGTGCCQTLFHTTPAQVAAAQSTATACLKRVTRYAAWLPPSSFVSDAVAAIELGVLDPAQWQIVDALLVQLDQLYGVPIVEVERWVQELREAPRPQRLVKAGHLMPEEGVMVQKALAAFAPGPVAGPALTREELDVVRIVHDRLAKQPYVLEVRTLKNWAQGKTPLPTMDPRERDREEKRMPNWSANLWVANWLLPKIREGTVTHVLDVGAGQEPLYRLLGAVGGPAASAAVINVEVHPETYATQRNPRQLHMSATDLKSPRTPPPTDEANAAAILLTHNEQVDATVFTYVLDQLPTPTQHKQAIAEATRVTKPDGWLVLVLPRGRELSQPYLEALEKLGWTRLPGFPAEVPRADQLGLPDAVKAVHREQLREEGLDATAIEQVLAIEERFFQKPSYAMVLQKTATWEPARAARISPTAFTLVDVAHPHVGASSPIPHGTVLRGHFVYAQLLAETVMPEQLPIQPAPYRTKTDLRAAVAFRGIEPRLQQLGRYLVLFPARLRVNNLVHSHAEVQQLLTLWRDPAVATFNEDDLHWLAAAHRTYVAGSHSYPAAVILERLPHVRAEVRELESKIPAADDDARHANGELRVALDTDERVTLAQLNGHFERYRTYVGMLFPEADQWYREHYPPQPPYEMIPTTLHGHLLVTEVYATSPEQLRFAQYLQRLESPRERWTPGELRSIHTQYCEAMARDTEWERSNQRRYRNRGGPIWSVKGMVEMVHEQRASERFLNDAAVRALHSGLLSAVAKRIPRGWDSVLIMAGWSPQEIETQRREVSRMARQRAAETKGQRAWRPDTIRTLIRTRNEAGKPLYVGAIRHDGYGAAVLAIGNSGEWKSWEEAIADTLGLPLERVTKRLDEERAKDDRVRAQKSAATQGKTVWTRATIAELIRNRNEIGAALLPGSVVSDGHSAAVIGGAGVEWGSWEKAIADVLGLSLEQVSERLSRERTESRRIAARKSAGAQGRTVWTREAITALVLTRNRQGESLVPRAVSDAGFRRAVSVATEEWGSWERALADILKIQPQTVARLLGDQRVAARQKASQEVVRLRQTKRAVGSGDPDAGSGGSANAGMEEQIWNAENEALHRAGAKSVEDARRSGVVVTARAIFGARASKSPGIPGLIRSLQQLDISVAMLGGTPEEQATADDLLGIPSVTVENIGDYQAAVRQAKQLLEVRSVRIIRERGDPAPVGVAATTVDLADLARQWPVLLDDLEMTVEDLSGLEEANREAARLLWQA